ncbi:MAG: hypothetical protein RR303_03405 [Bacteroidales bacterium]
MKAIKETNHSVVRYHLVKRAIPGKPGIYGYAPSIVYRGEISFDEVCRFISERSTLCHSDVVQVTHALLTNAIIRLKNSEAFTMGPLGYLTTALKSDLVKDPNDFRHHHIRKAYCVFVPSREFRKEIEKVELEQVKVMPPIPRHLKNQEV